jgi:heme exporter protein D
VRRPLGPWLAEWALQAVVSSGAAYLFVWQIKDPGSDSVVTVLTCAIGIVLPVKQLRAVVAGVMRRQMRVFTDPPKDSEGG